MAEESLSERELGGGEKVAFARTVELPPYEPDLKAYEVDPANDPYRRFTEAIEAGATIELSLPTIDGRREYLELNSLESKASTRKPAGILRRISASEGGVAGWVASRCERRTRSSHNRRAAPQPRPRLGQYS